MMVLLSLLVRQKTCLADTCTDTHNSLVKLPWCDEGVKIGFLKLL